VNKWQGNPERIEHRRIMIQRSLAAAMLENMPYEQSDEEVDRLFAERNIYRASGDAVCHMCGLTYKEHPIFPYLPDWDGWPRDHELCDGDIVHL